MCLKKLPKRLDWRAGDDRGRIWRLIPEDQRIDPRPFAHPETTESLVAMLADGNGWRRQLAQRLIVERLNKTAVPKLRAMLRNHSDGFARLHAMWSLEGLGELTASDVRVALDSADTQVRCDAIELSAHFLKSDTSLLDRLAALASGEDQQVRFEVALALGETDEPRAANLLAKLALRDGDDKWFCHGDPYGSGKSEAVLCWRNSSEFLARTKRN